MENTQYLFFGKSCTNNLISLVPATSNTPAISNDPTPSVNIYKIEHGGIEYRFLEEKLSRINIPTINNINNYTDNELCMYITTLLSSFLDESFIPHLVNTQTMKEWKKCFTHVTFDPVNNYETNESVGDKIMSYTFKTFVYMKIPDITDGELSNLDQLYMSTNLQSYISNRMKLSYWLKRHKDVQPTSEKRQEDILEAFFGTIDTILIKNPSYGYGFGVKICLKFFEKIFQIDHLQANRDYEPPKTFFQQFFKRLGIPSNIDGFVESKPEEVIDESGNVKQFIELKLTKVSIDILKRLNKLPKQTTWNDKAGTKKEVSSKLYLQAAASLYEAGITSKWIVEFKHMQDNKNINEEFEYNNDIMATFGKNFNWYQALVFKAQQIDPNVKDVIIKNSYTDLKTVIYQIIGITNTTKKVMYSRSFEKSKNEKKNKQMVDTVVSALRSNWSNNIN